jgi:predicted membrane protein
VPYLVYCILVYVAYTLRPTCQTRPMQLAVIGVLHLIGATSEIHIAAEAVVFIQPLCFTYASQRPLNDSVVIVSLKVFWAYQFRYLYAICNMQYGLGLCMYVCMYVYDNMIIYMLKCSPPPARSSSSFRSESTLFRKA